MQANVVRAGDKVVIANTHGWFLGDKESSPFATLEIVLDALGHNISYDYLVGVSGQAFRMQVSETGFCGSSPHAACGYQCGERVNEAIPYKLISVSCKQEDIAQVREIRKRIVASIDKGVPVGYGSEENGVIVGYQKNGDEWIAYDYYKDGGTKQCVVSKWPWGITFYEKKESFVPARRDMALGAIKQAIAMADTPHVKGYYLGFKAWEVTIQRLEELSRADDKTRSDVMVGNSWLYECLASYRKSAAVYLRNVAPDFPDAPKAHLLKAADSYDKMSKDILTGKECVLTIAPTPWSLKQGGKWTPEMIKEEVRRLRLALESEKTAIEELRAAAKGI